MYPIRSFVPSLVALTSLMSQTALAACGDPVSHIHQIQGNTNQSQLMNQQVSVEGIVTAVFQGNDSDEQLSGFFVQEETSNSDQNTATSEGIFVYHDSTPVIAGQRVHLQATVAEYYDMTQLQQVTALQTCGSADLPEATSLRLPLETTSLEHLEGMLVRLPQTLDVTLHHNFARYGLSVVSLGRRFQPTELYLPGTAEANALQTENQLNQLLIDDGSNAQYPEQISYFPALSSINPLRSGSEITGLVGVIHYAFGAYRLLPVGQPEFIAANPRNAAPTHHPEANLTVATYNTENLFNHLNDGSGRYRGADSAEEQTRQFAKVVSTVLGIDADVVVLNEIENDGFAEGSTIARLVTQLNASLTEQMQYQAVIAGDGSVGGDSITSAIIYRGSVVEPIGEAALFTEYPFDQNTARHRIPLIQRFLHLQTDNALTITSVHLKSKGSNCDAMGDPDIGDGQGNCNGLRTDAAQALITKLGGEENLLLLGDFNAYSMEDPIQLLIDNNFHHLVPEDANDHYSFIFDELLGSLDHAFSDQALRDSVLSAEVWHINTDEPEQLDYNLENKTATQRPSLYSEAAYRSSDHDPLVISLRLQPVEQSQEEPVSEQQDSQDGGGGGLGLLLSTLALAVLTRRKPYLMGAA